MRNNPGLSSNAVDDDAHQRGAGRNRRAALTGGTAVFARAVQIGTSLITIPLTFHYLGNERFGLWMTISSFLALANFADFGVGNGVLNAVAEAFGKNDFASIRTAVSSGFAVLSAIGVLLFALCASTLAWIAWADVFRVTSTQARAEAAPSLVIFAACFALNIPLDLVQRVQLGLQEGFRTNFWQICGSIAGLVGVVVGIRMHAGLPLLVSTLAGAPVLATTCNSVHFFAISRPDLMPRRQLVSREAISRIVRTGALFFVMQLVIAVAYSADNIIIARTMGAAQVPGYSIPQRMFSLISVMVTMLIMPLWPAYGEAISRGDMAWARRTLRRSLIAVFGATVIASSVLLLLGARLISWWVGPAISPPFILLAGLATWTVVECSGNTLSVFLNGANFVRAQAIVAGIFGVACLSLKIYLIRRFGIVAIPWATLLTYVPIVGIACAVFIPRVLKHLHLAPPRVTMATPIVED